MNQEFETKVVDVDPASIISQLRTLGAHEEPEFLSKRYVYVISTENIEWIRLRQQGEKPATMTYKYKVRGNTAIGKTIELEVQVSDFDKTKQILDKLAFLRVYYQENKSHVFHLHDIEFSIDTWPLLPSYLEVEAHNIESVQEGLRLLGLEGKDVGDKDIKVLYSERGINMHDRDELRF